MSSPISKYDFGLWSGNEPPSPLASNILLQRLAEERRRREEEKRLESYQPSLASVYGGGLSNALSSARNAFFPERDAGQIAAQEEVANKVAAPWEDPESVDKANKGILQTMGGNVKQVLDTGVGMASDAGYTGSLVDSTQVGNESGRAFFNVALNAVTGRALPQRSVLEEVPRDSPFSGLARGTQAAGEGLGGMALDLNSYLPSRMLQGIQSGQMLRGVYEGVEKGIRGENTPEDWGNLAPLAFGAGHFGKAALKGGAKSRSNPLMQEKGRTASPIEVDPISERSAGFDLEKQGEKPKFAETDLSVSWKDFEQGKKKKLPGGKFNQGTDNINNLRESLQPKGELERHLAELPKEALGWDQETPVDTGRVTAKSPDSWDRLLEAQGIKDSSPKGVEKTPERILGSERKVWEPEPDFAHNTAGLAKLLKNKGQVGQEALEALSRNPRVKQVTDRLLAKHGDGKTLEFTGDGSYHNIIDIGDGKVLRINNRPFTKGEKAIDYPKIDGVLQPFDTETIRDGEGNAVAQVDILPKVDTSKKPTQAQFDALSEKLLRNKVPHKLIDQYGSNNDNVVVIDGKAVALDAGAVAPIDVSKKYESLKNQQIPKGPAFAAARKEKFDAVTDMQASLRRGGFDFDEGDSPFSSKSKGPEFVKPPMTAKQKRQMAGEDKPVKVDELFDPDTGEVFEGIGEKKARPELERRQTPRSEGLDRAYEPSLADLKRERDTLFKTEGPESEGYKQAVRDFNYANTGKYEGEAEGNKTFEGMREEALGNVGKPESAPKQAEKPPTKVPEPLEEAERGSAKKYRVQLDNNEVFKASGTSPEAVLEKVNKRLEEGGYKSRAVDAVEVKDSFTRAAEGEPSFEAGIKEGKKVSEKVEAGVVKESEFRQKLIEKASKQARELHAKEKATKEALVNRIKNLSAKEQAIEIRREARKEAREQGKRQKFVEDMENAVAREKASEIRGEAKKLEAEERRKLQNTSKSGFLDNPIVRVFNSVKSLVYGGDVGHLLRQGKQMNVDLLFSKHAKKVVEQFPVMFKAAKSEKYFNDFHEKLYTDPDVRLATDTFGLDMPGVGKGHLKEEVFHGSSLENVAVIGKYYAKPSERIYTAGLNFLRAAEVKKLFGQLRKNGFTPENAPEKYKGVTRAINIMSQRGEFSHSTAKVLADASFVFGAPRAKAARVQNLIELFRGGESAKVLRTTAAKMLVFNLGMMGLMKLARPNGEIVTDPDRTDYGKFRDGNITVDMSTGLGTTVRTVMQSTNAMLGNPAVSPHSGKEYSMAPTDPVVKELANMTAPGVRAAWILASGRDLGSLLIGKPKGGYLVDRVEALKAILPMSPTEITELLKSDEGMEKIIYSAMMFAGEGVNRFDYAENKKKQADLKKSRGGKKGSTSSFSYTPSNSSGIFNSPYKSLNLGE